MRNKVLKLYIVAVYLLATVVMFGADPGDDSDTGTMEDINSDSTGTPIDDYVWILVAVGLLFAFMKFMTLVQKNSLKK